VRVLLFTGKGGVGKTTVAAATAAHAARRGVKTLVVSTDGAHSLRDAVATGTAAGGGEPVEVDTGLYVGEVDPRGRLERSWGEVQDYLLAVLDAAGVDPIAAEELTVLPGAEEVLALLELRDQVRSGRFDLVVVDCAPTAETLRLLALPEALRWYLDRIFPADRRVARALRPLLQPVLGRAAGVPVPRDRVFAGVDRLQSELSEVRELLTDAATSVRLVLTPEAVVVAEARRTLTSLALYGYRVDGVVANRVFPAGGPDPFRARWVETQRAGLAEAEFSFAPLPVRRALYQPREPVGPEALARFAAEIYGDEDPLAGADPRHSMSVAADPSGEFVLSLALPLVRRRDVELARSGDDLVVTVGPHRRILALPSALRRCDVVTATLEGGRLSVRFRPDPALWRSR
jgi:arsenite/tail-anchored protein-transporting ATPase